MGKKHEFKWLLRDLTCHIYKNGLIANPPLYVQGNIYIYIYIFIISEPLSHFWKATKSRVPGLVLVPTRELALQTSNILGQRCDRCWSWYLHEHVWLQLASKHFCLGGLLGKHMDLKYMVAKGGTSIRRLLAVESCLDMPTVHQLTPWLWH